MNTSKSVLASMAMVAVLWSYAAASGGQEVFNKPPNPPQQGEGQPDAKPKEPKKDFPDYDEVVTKDFKQIPVPPYASGPFYKLYHNPKTDQLLGAVPAKHLEKNVMISSSIVAAPFVAGWMWGDQVVRWERRDKKLLLIEPDLRNEGKEGQALSDAVRRTYTDRVVRAVKILTLAGQDPVIDLGELFKKDFAEIGRVFGGKLDGSLAQYVKGKVKCFENNIVVTVESPLIAGQGGWTSAGSGTLITVNYNISSMPETGYKPRMADSRIGYFMTVRRDWGKGYKEQSLFNRYINRWHLEKQDDSLAVSPVKKPIVFYVEKTVPVRFRQAVKEGILEWNKAFEACGFMDAMQVRLQTENNEFRHLDPEDVNYNFFRWTTTGSALAVGPSRANPLTGQIYDADIVFDDAWVRYPVEAHATFAPSALGMNDDPRSRAFFQAHPEFAVTSRQQRLLPGFEDDLTAKPGPRPDYDLLQKRFARNCCNYGTHLQHELSFAYSVIAALGYEEIPETFVQQLVKEVAMHEVGHTLGLRHNFKASTWLPLEEVLARPEHERPLGGSVMDYNAFMFNQDRDKQGDFCMTTLGPWDLWVIEYGYRPLGEPFKTEDEMLKSLTDRVAEAGLDYATDEDTWIFNPDPLTNRRDMGSDPLEYARYRIALVQKLRQDMQDWGVRDGESYSLLRKRFNRLLGEMAGASIFAGRYIGGQYVHRDHKGDPNARDPFVPVPAAKQREVMQFLADNIFAAEAYRFDPQLLNKLAPGRFGHWDSDDYNSYIEFDLDDRIEQIMRLALMPLYNPFTINRLHNMERMYEADEDPYTLAEHVEGLTSICWKELEEGAGGKYSEREPYIDPARRGLQRAYTRIMIMFVTSEPGNLATPDAYALLRMTGEELHQKVAKAAKNRDLDTTSRAHLMDVERRLRKALDAEYIQG